MGRLENLMGGKRQMDMAKRAARRALCMSRYGSHIWKVCGAEKGRILIYQCEFCGEKKKEVL